MAKRFKVEVMNLDTKDFEESKSFDKSEDANAFKDKLVLENPLGVVVKITDNLSTPKLSEAIKEKSEDTMPKAKVVKVKTSYIEIDKNGKEWKITSSKLGRPLTTESVIKATGYLTRICKRLDLASATCALEHAKNIGKHIIAGDTYGGDPSLGNAFTSPETREFSTALVTDKPYEVFCDSCNILMVPDKKDEAKNIRETYSCPECGWRADTTGIQEPSLTSDPTSFPLKGPSEYERGGSAFVNYSSFSGNGFTVKAVDEEKKEKKKERESGLDTVQRGAINTKLLDASKTVREYLVNVQVIVQVVKDYQKELMEALGIKELKKQAELMEPAIKEMLDQLSEHEKQIQGVEYRLKDAHKRTILKSMEDVNPIIEEIKKLVSKNNVKEFDILREQLYKTVDVQESFIYSLSKRNPEVDKEIEEVKKTIELLKTKKDLPKEEITEVEEKENAGEDKPKASVSIDSRIDALVTAKIIEKEMGTEMKEVYKKDPKIVRKEIRKLEAKIATPVEGEKVKEELATKEESKSKEGIEYSYRVFKEDVKDVTTESGSGDSIPKGAKVFINTVNGDQVTFSYQGTTFVEKMDFIKKHTEKFKGKEASFHVESDIATKISEYWEMVKVFFKDIIKPFTNFVTIANSEWLDVNDRLDEIFRHFDESEMTGEQEIKKASSIPGVSKLWLTFNHVQENLEKVEAKLEDYKSSGEIIEWTLIDSNLGLDKNVYEITPMDVHTKDLLVTELREFFEPSEFFIKEASLQKKAYKIEEFTDFDPDENVPTDTKLVVVRTEGEETADHLWAKIESADIKEYILQSYTDEHDDLVIEVLTPDLQEAKDIIARALEGSEVNNKTDEDIER